MKISVLTFSKETNFGANLQCYALCKTLQNMGHNVDIIDFQLPPYSMTWYSAVLRIPRLWLFRQFRKQHLNIFTRHYNSVDELEHDCPKSDLYIVGSDQVWNQGITKRLAHWHISFLSCQMMHDAYLMRQVLEQRLGRTQS